MGERGPKPTITKLLEPARRAELDEAIVDGRKTKMDLYEAYGKHAGITYRAFCTYCTQLENRAKHRYVGKLITKVFGSVPDADIDSRARGIMVAMLDRVASDVLQDGELKPRDLREIVQSYDMMRRGAIAESQEKRRQTEYNILRMAGVAEAAVWIKRELEAEITSDPELRDRLSQAVDGFCAGIEKPKDGRESATLLKELSKKFGWKNDVLQTLDQVFGLKVADAQDKPAMTEAMAVAEIKDIYNPGGTNKARYQKPVTNPNARDVAGVIDDHMRGKLSDNGQ